jgi:hypothetical protein
MLDYIVIRFHSLQPNSLHSFHLESHRFVVGAVVDDRHAIGSDGSADVIPDDLVRAEPSHIAMTSIRSLHSLRLMLAPTEVSGRRDNLNDPPDFCARSGLTIDPL